MPIFTGAIPKPVVEQTMRIADLENETDVFICCSGSFRSEQALGAAVPTARLHSNDVSILSVAIGRLLVERALPLKFVERLSFLEDACERTPLGKLAGIGFALTVGQYAGKNTFAQAHFAHYRERATDYLEKFQLRCAEIPRARQDCLVLLG